MPGNTLSQLWRPRTLREYAFIADGERGGLIGPDGAIVWLCVPKWDSQAVFSALLGGRGGYAITPANPWHVWGGHYENGTLIWRSRWVGSGVVESREALAMPADPHRAVILRRVEALEGPAHVHVILDVRAGFGQSPMSELGKVKGIWSGRSGSGGRPVYLRWSGASRARMDSAGSLAIGVTVPAGQFRDFVLEISDRPISGPPVDPEAAWQATEEAWANAVPSCEELVAARDARHAYAIMRGMTAASGAMVAAATTSLPERLDGVRNYDYRYAWIRDQCYAGLAMAAHGSGPQLAQNLQFITARLLEDGPDLAPAYTIAGKRIPVERRLRLAGYPGSSARAGNRVNEQFQLDALGECLQLLAAAARQDMLSADDWHAAEVAVTAIEQRWRQPDAGIWELHADCWTHSRLACVAGLRAIAAAAGGPSAGRAARWSSLADAILAGQEAAVHPSGRWQRTVADQRVDAALLLPVVRGAVAPGDPRSLATVEAVGHELADDGFVYRFRHDDRPLHESEGAFLLCGFWMAMTDHIRGNEVEAAHWFERNRTACGPAGLYTEEYDVHQRQLRGNLPQAFVHAAMLESAVQLSSSARLRGVV